MNDNFDPLEAELSALRPHAPSASLKQRIAQDQEAGLLTPKRSPPTRGSWIGAFTGSLIAACFAVSVLVRLTPVEKLETEAPHTTPELPLATAFDNTLPTIWTYQRAFARSQRDLDAMFDRHAALSLPPADRVPAHLFIHADSQRLLQGEL